MIEEEYDCDWKDGAFARTSDEEMPAERAAEQAKEADILIGKVPPLPFPEELVGLQSVQPAPSEMQTVQVLQRPCQQDCGQQIPPSTGPSVKTVSQYSIADVWQSCCVSIAPSQSWRRVGSLDVPPGWLQVRFHDVGRPERVRTRWISPLNAGQHLRPEIPSALQSASTQQRRQESPGPAEEVVAAKRAEEETAVDADGQQRTDVMHIIDCDQKAIWQKCSVAIAPSRGWQKLGSKHVPPGWLQVKWHDVEEPTKCFTKWISPLSLEQKLCRDVASVPRTISVQRGGR